MDTRNLLMHFTRNGRFRDKSAPVMVRGEGVHVMNSQGRKYLDGLSALYCNMLGYDFGAEIGEAAASAISDLAFWPTWSAAHPKAIELADRLVAESDDEGAKFFFTNGGSESVESAWKIARQFHLLRGEPQRVKAISRRSAYHGVTLGALSFTALEPMKAPFGPHPVDVKHVSNTKRFGSPHWPDDVRLTSALLAEVRELIESEGADTIAAIIAEPVQNAGGSIPPPEGYWAGLREIADSYGIVLIADEVICGFGRLGYTFGHTYNGVYPDISTFAKGLTAGYAPMGAVMVSSKIVEPFISGDDVLLHGITFAGHPISAAVALKVQEIYEREGVFENVRRLEPHLAKAMEGLLGSPHIGDVRGAGFLWSAELVKDESGAQFTEAERARLIGELLPKALDDVGLIARPDDRGSPVLQIAPPIVADEAVLDRVVDLANEAIAQAMESMALE